MLEMHDMRRHKWMLLIRFLIFKWPPFAKGINKSDDRLIIILDHKKILDQLH